MERGEGSLDQIGEIAGTMYDTDDFNTGAVLLVKDEVAADDVIPHGGRQVWAGGTKFGIAGQAGEGRLEAIELPIGGGRVFGGDVEPDFQKVLLGAG